MRFTFSHNKKAPCIDCPDKGCGAYHDICPKYIAFRESCKTGGQLAKEEKRREGYLDHKRGRR